MLPFQYNIINIFYCLLFNKHFENEVLLICILAASVCMSRSRLQVPTARYLICPVSIHICRRRFFAVFRALYSRITILVAFIIIDGKKQPYQRLCKTRFAQLHSLPLYLKFQTKYKKRIVSQNHLALFFLLVSQTLCIKHRQLRLLFRHWRKKYTCTMFS